MRPHPEDVEGNLAAGRIEQLEQIVAQLIDLMRWNIDDSYKPWIKRDLDAIAKELDSYRSTT